MFTESAAGSRTDEGQTYLSFPKPLHIKRNKNSRQRHGGLGCLVGRRVVGLCVGWFGGSVLCGGVLGGWLVLVG